MGVSASFDPRGDGLAVFSLSIDGVGFTSGVFNATNEALGDLLRLGVLAASGGSGEAWFCYEPGDLRLVCTRYRDFGPARTPMMRVEAYEIYGPTSQGELLLDAGCPADQFALRMLTMGQNVLGQFGAEGYETEFDHLFPARALEVLEFAVTKAKQPNHCMATTEEPEIAKIIIIENDDA